MKYSQGDLVKIKSIGCSAEIIRQSGEQCAVEVEKKCFALRADGQEEIFEIMERVIVAEGDIELISKAEGQSGGGSSLMQTKGQTAK